MLHGKTLIQLKNAKTGEIEKEIEKHNMITNAIQRIVSPPLDAMCTANSYKTILDTSLPLSTKGLAGIMLWKEPITESADNLIAPIDNEMVGNAGGAYSGTNVLRGTLNTNETCDITNGKRFVWDFGTDKANSKISALSLTSLTGGNSGCKNMTDNIVIITAFSNFISSLNECILGEVSPGVICTYVHTSNTNTVTLKYYKVFESSNIGLFSNPNAESRTLLDSVTITLDSAYYSGKVAINEAGILTIVISTVYTSVRHIQINVTTRTLISDETITLTGIPSEYSSSSFVPINFHNGYYYGTFKRSSVYDILAFDENNEYIGAVLSNLPGASGDNVGYVSGYMVLQYTYTNTDSRYYFIAGTNANIVKNTNAGHVPKYSYRASSIFPYYFGSADSASSNYMVLLLYMPYLATINNLESAITKTAAQTMKITYEIYEADE